MTRPRTRRPIVFLGPSLPLAEALRLCPSGDYRPPARQGDVWRALEAQPAAIALIDGVFESQPSVWHRELLDALSEGIPVLGAASMGALRAAELCSFGMEGVGRIYAQYRSGELIDDADVALLHAGPEAGFRPLTVPLVDVREVADAAARAGALSQAEARVLEAAATAMFYQDRRWPALLDAVARSWRSGARERFERFARKGLPSAKARDARECLRRAEALAGANAMAGAEARAKAAARGSAVPLRLPSSHARLRRLLDGRSHLGGRAIENRRVLLALEARADAAELTDRGLRRLLLAGHARALGLGRDLAGSVSSAPADASALASSLASPLSGLTPSESRALLELLALDRLALDSSSRLVADGPSRTEALALEARVGGVWQATARQLLARTTPRNHSASSPRASPRRRR